jgi:hypothetical protein
MALHKQWRNVVVRALSLPGEGVAKRRVRDLTTWENVPSSGPASLDVPPSPCGRRSRRWISNFLCKALLHPFGARLRQPVITLMD